MSKHEDELFKDTFQQQIEQNDMCTLTVVSLKMKDNVLTYQTYQNLNVVKLPDNRFMPYTELLQ